MRSASKKPRPIPGLMLCGMLLVAACLGGADTATAMGGFGGGGFGGFGRMGGFGRGGGMGGGMGGGPRGHMTAPHRDIGKFGDRSSGRGGRDIGLERGGGSRGHRTIGDTGNPDGGRRGWEPRGGGRDKGTGPDTGVAVGGGIAVGGAAAVGAAGAAGINQGGNNGRSGVPPSGERRYVPDEVLTAFSGSTSPQAIDQIARRYNLTRLESQNFPLLGTAIYRWHIGSRQLVPNVVGALEDERAVASAQPNYVFTLQEDGPKIAADAHGDAAQYVLNKLQIEQAHRVAMGKSILVVAIDSEIDAKHPDLDGSIVKSFDAVGGEEKPQQHGTAMAGAIAAHKRLLGIAPGVRLLAARAFDDTPGGARGTSFAIYKSIEWAAENGARVVNMSFSGPYDPALHRMLAAAYDKNLVLIAAAGNAGPNSPPLYPAADPSVIAVTATDSKDGLFKMANRGQYIAIAAPGVEILALAPGDSYQVTTGTSVAAAHVSGVAALLLEREPSLKPKDVRAILMTTAKPLGSASEHADFGAGLVNAERAVTLPDGKTVGDGDEQAKR
jgi:Subtilase family